jgi:hypothetical protein
MAPRVHVVEEHAVNLKLVAVIRNLRTRRSAGRSCAATSRAVTGAPTHGGTPPPLETLAFVFNLQSAM